MAPVHAAAEPGIYGSGGLTLDPAQCRTLLSRIGQAVYPYQFCTLRQAG